MDLTGREIIAGFKKAAAWGTAVAAGANDGILLQTESLPQTIEHLADEALGVGFVESADQGKETSSGEAMAWLRYEGLSTLIALAMGQAGAPAQQGATAAWLHTLKLADSIDGLFGTLAIKKKSDRVFEWPSVKVSGFTLRGGMRMPTEITFPLIANTLNRNAAGGVNNTTTIAGVTYRTKSLRALVDENGYVRMNDQGAAALAGGDAILPSEWTLTFRRPMEGDHLIDGSAFIAEPRATGFPEVTLELQFPQYSDANDTFWSNFTAKTAKKLELLIKGPLIASTFFYQYLIKMPHLEIVEIGAPLPGPGKIPSTMRLRGMGASAAPAGMTGVTKPFQIELINTITTDALA